jgi:ABC-2 type transport system permease protein
MTLRPLRLTWLYFRIGALNDLQYRANFWLQLLQSVIQLATGLAVLALVFSQTPELNGWSQPALLAVMAVHILMGGVIGALIQPSMERLRQDIREGTFDFVLTKPEDAQVLSSVREIRIWEAVDVIVGLVVLAFAVGQLRETLGPIEAVAFAIALVLGGLMIYSFWLIITTIAFWIVRIDEIAELFQGLYQSGRWPVTIYPAWLRASLTYLVPIAFAVTVPAQALTARLTPDTMATAAAFALVAVILSRAFFRFGLRRYSGASS